VKYSLTCLWLFILFACAPPVFQAVDSSTLNDNLQTSTIRSIYLDDNQFSDAAELVSMINKGKWPDFTRRIPDRADENGKLFLRAIPYLYQEKYEEALSVLSQLPDDAFHCQALVLKTDCLYLLKRTSVQFRDNYQSAWDCSTHPQVKSIIKARFRLINYGI
jgi:hypothetical protein